MLTFEKWLEEKGITLHPWQKQASDAFLRVLYAQQGKAKGKTLLVDMMLEFVNRHGNEFEVERNPLNCEEFPALSSGGNRPVAWQYQLDTVEGHEIPTNSVTIFSRPGFEYDESGENGNEKFAVVYLTRAEVAKILETLEEDIGEMRKYCPGDQFE